LDGRSALSTGAKPAQDDYEERFAEPDGMRRGRRSTI